MGGRTSYAFVFLRQNSLQRMVHRTEIKVIDVWKHTEPYSYNYVCLTRARVQDPKQPQVQARAGQTTTRCTPTCLAKNRVCAIFCSLLIALTIGGVWSAQDSIECAETSVSKLEQLDECSDAEKCAALKTKVATATSWLARWLVDTHKAPSATDLIAEL